MAQIEVKHLDFHYTDDFISAKAVIKHTLGDKPFISITGVDCLYEFVINLDKSTAIKFAKTLRTEINKIQE